MKRATKRSLQWSRLFPLKCSKKHYFSSSAEERVELRPFLFTRRLLKSTTLCNINGLIGQRKKTNLVRSSPHREHDLAVWMRLNHLG